MKRILNSIFLLMFLNTSLAQATPVAPSPARLPAGIISKGSVSIGTANAANSSAALDVNSTTKGVLIPRMSQAQRDAIVSPATGLQVFNTDTNKPNYYNGTAWTVVGSGSGGGVVNDLPNGDAETDATGWATYNDGALAGPVDGTGGTSAITWTRSTSSPLQGAGSFLFTKPSSNAQGSGASSDFSIPIAQEGKRLTLTFDYTIASGTYANSDVSLYLYDVTNGTFCDINKGRDLPTHSMISAPWVFTFDSHNNSTSYRLIIHVASTSTSAYTLKFDNFILGNQSKTTGPPITPATAYPIVVGADTTAPTKPTGAIESATWWRVGDHMEIDYVISWSSSSGGANGSGTYIFPMPAGYNIDFAKLPGNTGPQQVGVGWGRVIDAGNNAQLTPMIYGTQNAFYLVGKYSTNSTGTTASVTHFYLGSTNFNFTDASTQISFHASVPIAGWDSGMVLSNQSVDRPVHVFAHTAQNRSMTGSQPTVIYDVVDDDKTGAYNPATGIFTCDSDYPLEVNAMFNTSSVSAGGLAYSFGLLLNKQTAAGVNSQVGWLALALSQTTSPSRYSASGTRSVQCKTGDTYWVVSYADTATTFIADPASNYVSFKKTNVGQQTVGYQYTAPQTYILSGSGNFTVPTGASYVEVKAHGAGGGGGGSATQGTNNGGTGGTGGTTTFGPYFTATGGLGGFSGGNNTIGPAGGTCTIASPARGTPMTGNQGGGYMPYNSPSQFTGGGLGGAKLYGSGSGGMGGGSSATAVVVATGGASGGYCNGKVDVTSGQVIAYSVGVGGAAGGAGTSGNAGNPGENGYLEVNVYFSNAGDSSVPQNLNTSTASNGLYMNVARVAFSSGTTVCTLSSAPGGWVTSASSPSGQRCNVFFQTGIYPTTPYCFLQSEVDGYNDFEIASIATSGVQVRDSSIVDGTFTLFCGAPK